jgi:hypothetical protein
MRSYRMFEGPSPVPAGADVSDARARLHHFMAEVLRLEGAPAESPSADSDVPRLRSALRWRGFDWFRNPRLRWATVGLAAVLVSSVLLWGPGTPEDEIQLRGEPPRAAATVIAGLSSEPGKDATVVLGWDPISGADRYEVRLFRADLEQIGALSTSGETEMRLDPAQVDRSSGGPSTVLWRVVAFRGAVQIGVSEFRTFQLP